MAVLKRIKASTLMETLVASVLIIIVFMIASMILNNIFYNSIKNNTQFIENRIHELHYLAMNKELTLPYEETTNKWKITIEKNKDKEDGMMLIEAENLITKSSFQVYKILIRN